MSDLSQLIIDEEFERVIPPLEDDEFKQLRNNILQDGEVYHPITVWNNIIVDGHHRYKILKEHPEISFRICEKHFENRFEAVSWICLNQLGRRNLSNIQKVALMGRRFRSEKESHGASDGFRGNKFTASLVTHQNDALPEDSHITANRIAFEMGVARPTVERAEKFVDGLDAAEEVCPGITREIMSGKINPRQSDVAAIAKVPIEKRIELAESLRAYDRKLSDDQKKERKQKMELKRSIEKLDAMHTNPNNPKVSAESMLNSLRSDVTRATQTMEFYFREFPEILTEQQYRSEVQNALNIMKDYIKNLEEQLYAKHFISNAGN
ncbi:MAG: hypothetical protein PHY15_01025 [Eubacteriales bacterium]|nr:hypothetical protein [Eubacteriales bacterium]MDD4474361.1 hypothetical protein [Eubacteriales bacterium]